MKPDILITLLVGTAQASYYSQAAAANLKVPMGSSVNVGQGYEHRRFYAAKPPWATALSSAAIVSLN